MATSTTVSTRHAERFYPGMLIGNYSSAGDLNGHFRVKRVLGATVWYVKQRWYHDLWDRIRFKFARGMSFV